MFKSFIMIKKPFFYLLLPVLLFVNNVKAQPEWSSSDFMIQLAKMDFKMKRVVPPSPEAASLGQYGNIPISLYTGTPKISIPLAELTGSRLSLPVSLSYNATGFKPQDVASWVGLGWSLNAGGVITRSVMGNPDTDDNYFNVTNNYMNLPPTSDWMTMYEYMTKIQKGDMETQPDVYYYNFGNYSGKFLVKTDGTIIKKEKNNLKITRNGLSGFTITDDNGIEYFFNQTENSTIIPDDALEGIPLRIYSNYPGSWYLTSITAPSGNETISLSYYSTAAHKLFNNIIANNSVSYSLNNRYPSATWSGPGNVYSAPPYSSTIRKYLQSITLIKNGLTVAYINFNSAPDQRQDLDDADYPGERLLQSIQVYYQQKTSEVRLVKQFNFYSSYFVKNIVSPQPKDKRLRLDSLQEIAVDATAQSKPPYRFFYTTNTVPSLNACIDHWGFSNNGADPATTLVPSVDIGGQYFGGGADREPNFTGSSTAILNQIKYPTGGYTLFEYELNEAAVVNSQYQTVMKPAGGIRIKQMTDYSFENNKAIVKKYEYKQDDGNSSGKCEFPIYHSGSTYYNYYVPSYGGTSEEYDINYIAVSANSVAGLGFIQGSHIGYTQVTEYQTEVTTNVDLGKTVYNYRFEGFIKNDDHIANGDLDSMRVYDNSGKLIYRQDNTYGYVTIAGLPAYPVTSAPVQDNKNVLCKYYQNGTTYYAWKNQGFTSPVCAESKVYTTKLQTQGYSHTSWQKKLLTQTEKKYDQLTNSYITSTKTYTYGNNTYTMPTRIDQNTNNNEIVTIIKKYPLDFTVPTGVTLDDATKGIQLLQTKNIVGAEIESVQLRQNPDGSNKRYVSGLITTYYPLSPYPKDIYRLEMQAPLTSLQSPSISGSGNFSFDPAYKVLGGFKYDYYGNILEQAKNNDIPKSYIWDYYDNLPVAEVTNAPLADIAYTSFESTGFGNWTISGGTIYTSGGLTGSKGYTLNTGNSISKSGLNSGRQFIVSYWSRNGAIVVSNSGNTIVGNTRNGWTYYEHLLNTGITNVNITSSGATIDELRLFPKDAQMTTTTYYAGTGASTQSSVTSQFLNYEYDGLNRLLNIKDEDGNILKNYKYSYGLGTAPIPSAKTLFYNDSVKANFTRASGTCPAGTEPSTIAYKIAYGKYVSSISQADANAKAAADSAANGQNFANTYGLCLYWNDPQMLRFEKNNCSPDEGASLCSLSGPGHLRSSIAYSVAAHTYSSTISKEDANSKALAALATQGQDYANSNCWCSCYLEGQKMINGACETGVRYNSSAVEISPGYWQCTYYYQFSDYSTSQEYYEYSSSPCPIL